MNKVQKEILSRLKKHYPEAKTALVHANVFELLIATILSAQCTDVRVNIVTKELFKKYRKPKDYADLALEVLQQDIHSVNFYKNKAKHIIATCKRLIAEYKGNVPDSMEELITLAGVSRKTANVVLHTGFGKSIGVVVDTHVLRLANRLGFATQDTPVKVEQELMSVLPKSQWKQFSHVIIFHGRALCKARNPLCQQCFLTDVCQYYLLGD